MANKKDIELLKRQLRKRDDIIAQLKMDALDFAKSWSALSDRCIKAETALKSIKDEYRVKSRGHDYYVLGSIEERPWEDVPKEPDCDDCDQLYEKCFPSDKPCEHFNPLKESGPKEADVVTVPKRIGHFKPTTKVNLDKLGPKEASNKPGDRCDVCKSYSTYIDPKSGDVRCSNCHHPREVSKPKNVEPYRACGVCKAKKCSSRGQAEDYCAKPGLFVAKYGNPKEADCYNCAGRDECPGVCPDQKPGDDDCPRCKGLGVASVWDSEREGWTAPSCPDCQGTGKKVKK